MKGGFGPSFFAGGACMGGVGRAGTKPRLRRQCPALALLAAGLQRYAALPCRFAAAAQSRLRACGRFAGGRPLRRGAAAPAGSPAALRLLAAPAARLLRFAPAAVAARSAARPALASRPLRGSPLCPCACWAALSLSPVAPVLRLRASPARVAAARPARPPRRALSRLSLPPGGCAALGLSPSLAALCGVPPPGVGLFCGWRGGAPAGAGLGVPLAAASGDGRPLSRADSVLIVMGVLQHHVLDLHEPCGVAALVLVKLHGNNRRYAAYAAGF